MFVRVKRAGGYKYLQLVENRGVVGVRPLLAWSGSDLYSWYFAGRGKFRGRIP